MKKLSYLIAALALLVSGLLPNSTVVTQAADTNLIANPSMETPSVADLTVPDGWQQGRWGTNTATFTYDNSGHAGSRSVSVQVTSYGSGDAKWYFTPASVQPNTQYVFSDFYKASVSTTITAQFDDGSGNLSYVDLTGSVPSASAWQQHTHTFTTPANARAVTIFHLIHSVGTLSIDDASLTLAGQSNDTPPTVSVSAPTNGTTVSGAIALTASAADDKGIANVQFKVDGNAVGALLTTAPYATNWDSAAVSNGTHNVTAVATDTAGQSTNSAAVAITVSNNPAPPPAGNNLVTNPSVETPDPSNANQPQSWQPDSWGTNTAAFSYPNTGHTGTRSVSVQISSYADGDAKWVFAPVAVTSGQELSFSDYYQSNVTSYTVATFGMNDGSTVYSQLGTLAPSSSWAQYKTVFSVPLGAVDVSVYHLIQNVGQLTTDDYSLTPYTPVGFNQPLVSITFDDGLSSTYANGVPKLKKYRFPATFYIVSGLIGASGYMTTANLKTLASSGYEIGSHTVTHPDLTTLTPAQVTAELANSQASIQGWIGKPVVNFASPYGAMDNPVLTQVKTYYQSHRGVEPGFNDKGSFDPYNIKVQNVDSATTLAQMQAWVAQAKNTKTWLVLVFHGVDSNTARGGFYSVKPATLDSMLNAIKSSAVPVKTLQQALTDLTTQL